MLERDGGGFYCAACGKPSPGAESDASTQIVVVGGAVFMTLPGDQYVKMTPQQARDIGMRMFRRAFEAEGEPVPSMIIVKDENGNDD
jgi:hypothetical protein